MIEKTEPLTLEQVLAMPDYELNLAVARRIGYHRASHVFGRDWVPGISPDFATNISDSFKLEEPKYLPVGYRNLYINVLEKIIKKEHGIFIAKFELVHASPRERCQAFLLCGARPDGQTQENLDMVPEVYD